MIALFVVAMVGSLLTLVFHRDMEASVPVVVGTASAAPTTAVPGPNTGDATAAAVGFVESMGKVAEAGPLTRRDLVLAMATVGYGPQLVDQVDRQFDDLRFRWSGQNGTAASITWTSYPLTTHAEALADGRVRVRIWTVAVVSIGDTAVPRQIWSTASLELVDEHGWKVARWDTAVGPTPVSPGEAELPTAGAMNEVTGWSPVTEGGS